MLTYDIIIKHLMPAINTFSLQPNIVMKSVDFPFFSNIFDDTFYRFGVNNSNSSRQQNYTNSLNELINSVCYCLSDTNYAMHSANNINDIVKNLDINIIIFDFKNNKIMVEYKDNQYLNPWKPTIFLANYDEWWEPIVSKETKIFSFSSPKSNILKKNILNQNITRINGDNININDNFQEIIEMEGFNKKSISLSSDNDDDNYNNAFLVKEKPNRAQLNKMKKDELLNVCKQFNKTINNSSKLLKKDLIDIILND
jgi:hypothetical protein